MERIEGLSLTSMAVRVGWPPRGFSDASALRRATKAVRCERWKSVARSGSKTI